MVKNTPVNAGDSGLIPGSGGSSGEGNGNPLQYSCLGNPMERRSLVGYCPWSHRRVRHDFVTEQNRTDNTLRREYIFSIGAGVPGWLRENEGCSQCYFLALKCETLSA